MNLELSMLYYSPDFMSISKTVVVYIHTKAFTLIHSLVNILITIFLFLLLAEFHVNLLISEQPYPYIGCYIDTDDHDLNGSTLFQSNAMTLKTCFQHCKDSYSFFGVQVSRKCIAILCPKLITKHELNLKGVLLIKAKTLL